MLARSLIPANNWPAYVMRPLFVARRLSLDALFTRYSRAKRPEYHPRARSLKERAAVSAMAGRHG